MIPNQKFHSKEMKFFVELELDRRMKAPELILSRVDWQEMELSGAFWLPIKIGEI